MAQSHNESRSTLIVILIILCVILTGLVIYGWGRVKIAKFALTQYASQVSMKYAGMDSQEDAMMLGTTIAQFPTTAPLISQKAELQKYVTTLSLQTGRDIVVVDKNKMILADTVPANVGREYAEDKAEELKDTMTNGNTHTFIEKSMDYPQGIYESSVPMKDSKGNIIGAVIMSNSRVFMQ